MKQAFVDLTTGKIHGCEKGSLTYLHEKGHIIYNKSKQGSLNSFREQSAFQAAIYSAIFAFFFPFMKWIALIFLLGHWHYFLYEELWCWKYAYKKRREEK